MMDISTAKEIAEGMMDYYDAAVELMDDEIREELHMEMAPCTEIEFLTAYIQKHYDKYDEVFAI